MEKFQNNKYYTISFAINSENIEKIICKINDEILFNSDIEAFKKLYCGAKEK